MTKLYLSLIALAIALSGCALARPPEPVPLPADTQISVEWVKINPPPNYDGTFCWAYFSRDTLGAKIGYGFSGVYCP
jgi:hypothetical protein